MKYAIYINDEINIFEELPTSWGNIDGFNVATADIIKSKGFFPVVVPILTEYQDLGKIYFDSDNEIFTYPIVEIPFDLEAKKVRLITNLEIAEDSIERLINRCERVNGRDNVNLNGVIAAILKVQRDTRAAIPLLTEETGKSFQIKQSDIDYLKSLLEPFKVLQV